MHDMNKRQKRLLELLLENHFFKPVKHYANLLAVSVRTLYKDLDQLESRIPNNVATLEKKPRKGVFLRSGFSLHEILEYVDSNDQIPTYFPFFRQIMIARQLLVENKTVTYQELSAKFLVSKTSISNDIEQIQQVTKYSRIDVYSDHNGTKIIGEETDIQKAIKDYAYFIVNKIDHPSKFYMQFPQEVDYFLMEKRMIPQVLTLVQNIPNSTINQLSDNYFQSLILSVSILLIRIQQGFHVERKSYLLSENIASLTTYFLTKNLTEKLQVLKIELNKNDFVYLNKQLIAHGLEPSLENLDAKAKYENIIKEIIAEMSRSLEIDLTNDEKLFTNILYHLLSMIYRLKMDMPIKNPLLEEIKNNYSILYSTTWFVLSKYETDLSIQFNEDEIAFLAIHFQGAVDRSSESHRILIVCPTGIGTSELIANRLKKVLFPHDTLEVVSIRTLYQNDLNKVDLVISSVSLEKLTTPVVYVSSLMNQEDLKKVFSAYLELFYAEKEETFNLKFDYLSSIVDERLVFLNEKFISKKDCIEKMANELTTIEAVTPEFLEAVWQREQIGITDLPTGVAIPHPPADVVTKSKLVIMTLNKPIRWHSRSIRMILMICIAEKDISNVKGILSDVYKIVETEKNIEKLFFSKTKTEIIKGLGGKVCD